MMPAGRTAYAGAPAEEIAGAYLWACRTELEALKPGNVSVFESGHGMTARHFMMSADASGTALRRMDLGLGEKIYRAVAATQAAAGCNTNLGIVLLAAPLMHAAQTRPPGTSLRSSLRHVLHSTTVRDAEWVYRAIRHAAPAGLGTVKDHDVYDAPTVTLFEAMRAAAARDRVAFQYADAYSDIWNIGIPRFVEFSHRWEDPAWAAVAVYLGLLSRLTDTHVARKQGVRIASKVSRLARPIDRELRTCEQPQRLLRKLHALDHTFKTAGINPGTTADCTVATLLAARLHHLPSPASGGNFAAPAVESQGPPLHNNSLQIS